MNRTKITGPPTDFPLSLVIRYGVNVHQYYYELGIMTLPFQKDITKHCIPILNNTLTCV